MSSGTGQPDQWDQPLGGIVAQAHLVYERTQIEVAVAEVRFVRSTTDITEDAAVRVWDGLGRDQFPIFEPHRQQMVNVAITPSGAQQSTEVQQGWLIATSDRKSAITLLPATVVVQTQAYERYSLSLGDRLATVLPLYAEVTGATRVQRLGMRYVNRLTAEEAVSPSFWAGHVDPSFGAALRGPLGGSVAGLHQQLQLKLDSTAGARIQAGLLEEAGKPTRFSFLVDLDVFREQTVDYEPDVCGNHLRQLNRTALALFNNALSDDYLDTMGPISQPPNTDERSKA